MQDWNGNIVEFVRSKGGKVALLNPRDNLISTRISPWPPVEIVQKFYQSRQLRAFNEMEKEMLTTKLGYYTDLQSINSEDAITWSVFGTISKMSEKVRLA